MGSVTRNPRDRFNAVAGIRKHFEQQGWPIPLPALDQKATVADQVQKANARHPNAYINPKARKNPTVRELFSLALDAESGPFPHLRGLRFRVSRLVARRQPDDLGPPIRKHCGKTYKPGDSLLGTIKRFERGESIADSKFLAAFAETYHVKPAWLAGDTPELGTSEQLDHLARRAATGYAPIWLRPWQVAVQAAIGVCHALQRQNTMTDLFLCEPSYAGEMLERFFERRSADMADAAGKWSTLLYFPLAHAAMVEARYETLRTIPSWMISGSRVRRKPTSNREQRR